MAKQRNGIPIGLHRIINHAVSPVAVPFQQFIQSGCNPTVFRLSPGLLHHRHLIPGILIIKPWFLCPGARQPVPQRRLSANVRIHPMERKLLQPIQRFGGAVHGL